MASVTFMKLALMAGIKLINVPSANILKNDHIIKLGENAVKSSSIPISLLM
jgi:hypothetical protein